MKMSNCAIIHGFARSIQVPLAPVDTLRDRISATVDAHAVEDGAPDAVLIIAPAGALDAWPIEPAGYRRVSSRHSPLDVAIMYRRAA